MAKISAKLLMNRAKDACDAVGLDFGPHYEVGANPAWPNRRKAVVDRVTLANVPIYGGWDLEQITNEGGATRALNGHGNRMRAAEMLAFLDGMILAAHKIKAAEAKAHIESSRRVQS